MTTAGKLFRVGDYLVNTATDKIGSGSFATVYLARHHETGAVAALKAINKVRLTKKLQESVESEVSIMKKFEHPNIVRLFDIKKTDKHMYLFMEYCGGGDLHRFILEQKRLSIETSKFFLGQLASGLQFLHSEHCIHRDLKPQNLLLMEHSEHTRLKIADFGFARFLQQDTMATTLCGSPLYMAPEVLRGSEYDGRADLWSVGTILFEMLAGTPPFQAANHIELLRNIDAQPTDVAALGQDIADGDCGDMLRRLLRADPAQRLDFEEFFKHPFLPRMEDSERRSETAATGAADGAADTVTAAAPERRGVEVAPIVDRDLLAEPFPATEPFPVAETFPVGEPFAHERLPVPSDAGFVPNARERAGLGEAGFLRTTRERRASSGQEMFGAPEASSPRQISYATTPPGRRRVRSFVFTDAIPAPPPIEVPVPAALYNAGAVEEVEDLPRPVDAVAPLLLGRDDECPSPPPTGGNAGFAPATPRRPVPVLPPGRGSFMTYVYREMPGKGYCRATQQPSGPVVVFIHEDGSVRGSGSPVSSTLSDARRYYWKCCGATVAHPQYHEGDDEVFVSGLTPPLPPPPASSGMSTLPTRSPPSMRDGGLVSRSPVVPLRSSPSSLALVTRTPPTSVASQLASATGQLSTRIHAPPSPTEERRLNTTFPADRHAPAPFAAPPMTWSMEADYVVVDKGFVEVNAMADEAGAMVRSGSPPLSSMVTRAATSLTRSWRTGTASMRSSLSASPLVQWVPIPNWLTTSIGSAEGSSALTVPPSAADLAAQINRIGERARAVEDLAASYSREEIAPQLALCLRSLALYHAALMHARTQLRELQRASVPISVDVNRAIQQLRSGYNACLENADEIKARHHRDIVLVITAERLIYEHATKLGRDAGMDELVGCFADAASKYQRALLLLETLAMDPAMEPADRALLEEYLKNVVARLVEVEAKSRLPQEASV